MRKESYKDYHFETAELGLISAQMVNRQILLMAIEKVLK